VTTYDVRPATPEDLVRLSEVHVQVWREAYAGVMPHEYLAGLDPARMVEAWTRRIASPTPGSVLLVGTADGRLVGMATAGPSRDDPPDPPVELYAINVLAAHHGSGLASRLFETALDATAGDGPVSLWVLEVNARARAFYARYGFVPDGLAKRHPATGVPEIRLVSSRRRAPSE
jgi:GNAT superfamily N-acetyltransferase